jgi:hypothetical protein
LIFRRVGRVEVIELQLEIGEVPDVLLISPGDQRFRVTPSSSPHLHRRAVRVVGKM